MPKKKQSKKRPSVKDEKRYKALRKQSESKEKAARIANASHNKSRSQVGKKGGKSPSYDEWTKKELQKKASDIGIEGRSKMDKGELIEALRDH